MIFFIENINNLSLFIDIEMYNYHSQGCTNQWVFFFKENLDSLDESFFLHEFVYIHGDVLL